MNLQEHISLAPLTTFHIGGAARFFVEAHTDEEVAEAVRFARERSIQLFILGGGSNILIADEGFNGLVLSVCIPDITFENHEDKMLVTVGAGVVLDELVARTVAHGFYGLECLSGVPGTVGGAVVANIGAYGEQCSDTFMSADVIDLQSTGSESRAFKKEDCNFSYHDSIFGHEPGRYIILRATFAPSSSNEKFNLSYKDNRFNLAEFVSKNGREPTLSDVRSAVLGVREQKGALIMDGRLSYKSAGSFFHMPYVSAEKYTQIVEKARLLDAMKEERLRPWAWEQEDGLYKLAPGFLLEYTEFQKGYVRGAVGISPKHTLSIINVGDALAKDIAQLARDMQEAVEKIFGVHLEREVEYVGDVEQK